MREIFSERNGVLAEYISIRDIAYMLLGMTWPHMNDTYRFREFVLDLDPSCYWKLANDDYTFGHAVIRRCLSVLGMTQVKDDDKVLIELDDPDPDILPLSKNAQIKKEERTKNEN
jgi:hypothetical protein